MVAVTNSATTQKNSVPSWFMSNPFEKNLVYSRLLGMDFDYVIGMDIGHGEAMVYAFSRVKTVDEKGNIVVKPSVDRLQMNHEDDAKLPTLIRFTDDKAIIGKGAKKSPGFYQHFKTEPSKWDTKIDMVHTHEYLMKAFIRTLWAQVLQYQPAIAASAEKGRVLITVGCPSSEDWTSVEAMQKYQNLIISATKCKNVSVLPESTAAIMAAVLCVEETSPKYVLKLDKGIAVVDAGSSTIDFTYVRLGKNLITRSLKLGGHDLDEQMLEVAVEESGLSKDVIPDEQRQTILVQMREIKESYYPEQLSLGVKTIDIWGVDADGKASPDIASDYQLKFVANKSFMDKALNRKSIQLYGHLSEKESWLKLCEDFIYYTKTLISSYDKIILTGGTSFVTELKELVDRIYGGNVIRSRDPSSSVAKGLCYAKSLENQGRDYMEQYKKDVAAIGAANYKAFITSLAEYMSKLVYQDMADSAAAFTKVNGGVTVRQFLDDINVRARKNDRLVGKAGKAKLSELFLKYLSEGTLAVHAKTNEISSKIYGTTLNSPPKLSKLTEEQALEIIQGFNLTSFINESWTSTIIPSTVFSIFSTILFFVGSCFLIAGQLIVGAVLFSLSTVLDSTAVQQRLTGHTSTMNMRLSQGTILRLSRVIHDEDRAKTNIAKATEKATQAMMSSGLLKDNFMDSISEQAEIALGKVLFLVYDEKPN